MRDLGVHRHRRPTRFALAVVAASIVPACASGDASSDADDTTPADSTPADTTPADTTPADTTPADTTPASAPSTTLDGPDGSQPVAPSTDPVDSSVSSSTTTAGAGRLIHPAGLELRYPAGWTASASSKIATEFSQGAECASVEVVDFEPPTVSGEAEAGYTLRSVVQVCAQPTELATVEDFLAAVYGGTRGFERIEIDGETAYRQGDAADSIAFVLHNQFTVQVLTSVVAELTLVPQRIDELEMIVESIRFT